MAACPQNGTLLTRIDVKTEKTCDPEAGSGTRAVIEIPRICAPETGSFGAVNSEISHRASARMVFSF